MCLAACAGSKCGMYVVCSSSCIIPNTRSFDDAVWVMSDCLQVAHMALGASPKDATSDRPPFASPFACQRPQ